MVKSYHLFSPLHPFDSESLDGAAAYYPQRCKYITSLENPGIVIRFMTTKPQL